ncbi:MAG: sigma-70 family RNA polymerase sigma factor [Crocinitomicaceae bacterium]|nr:sigma-70 family RNA polymerase sigma factor [Crocinitomicaceae bacterium]
MTIFRKDISELSDEALVQLLSSRRSNEALTELHARYSKKVLGFFMRMFQGDVDKSQDFVQDLFVRILEKHHLFNPEKKFYTWMFTIASNMSKTSFRKLPNQRISEDEYELNEHVKWDENTLDKEAFRSRLKIVIDKLEGPHRMTFVLRFMEEMSIKEIAEILEISEGTVKSRLFYTTKKVAEQLKEFNPTTEGMIFKMN